MLDTFVPLNITIMKNIRTLFFCTIFLMAQGLIAQTFTPIDIRPGTNGSYPYNLKAFNGKVYFAAMSDTSVGNELWVSDGTVAGTSMLKDINPGSGSSSPGQFTVCNNKLFFTANDGVHGNELWVTDGTSAGTNMVADIWQGPSGSSCYYLTAMNGKVYFNGNDSIHGAELWVSDGTSAGTSLLKDIWPGVTSATPTGVTVADPGCTYHYQFTLMNNKLYFSAYNASGSELWSTDGTTAGTNMVADIWPGPGSSGPYCITPFNGNIIFSATDSLHGDELWISDGTTAGTSLLKDINPGTASGSVASYSAFTAYNGKLYFDAVQAGLGYEMWSTDGTSAGTTLVKDIWPGPGSSYAGSYSFAVWSGKLYFSAADSLNSFQLWTSDGTAAGTSLLKVISSYSPFPAYPHLFIDYNNQLMFTANVDTINGQELWVTDGTAAGTHSLSPAIAPNTSPLASTGNFVVANGKFFLSANFNSIGTELWVYTTPTSITETSGEHNIKAYPNPFSRAVSLSGLLSSERYTIQVYDMSGREFFSTEIENSSENVSVSMPDLSTGVYLMRVSGPSSSETFRLVKSN